MNMKDKIVLLTGAGGFLGKYFIEALEGAGATVIKTDLGSEADYQMDVTDQAQIDEVFKKVVEKYGRVDVVINNAAIDPKFDKGVDQNEVNFMNYPEEAMRQSVEVNMLGAWRVSKVAVSQMLKQGGGNIVNVASFYGVTPPRQEIYPDGKEKPVDYPMTKAALVMLTRHMAAQFGSQGIRSNALAPGGVLNNHDESFIKKYGAHTSLGRMNKPEEIANALLFLVSDDSSGMTGETLVVDCGWRSR
jgi:NAD(P)-dependent dehydrogenase (short-subunit alcohol dehydrogenase family)